MSFHGESVRNSKHKILTENETKHHQKQHFKASFHSESVQDSQQVHYNNQMTNVSVYVIEYHLSMNNTEHFSLTAFKIAP